MLKLPLEVEKSPLSSLVVTQKTLLLLQMLMVPLPQPSAPHWQLWAQSLLQRLHLQLPQLLRQPS